jgi:hypothetical protein
MTREIEEQLRSIFREKSKDATPEAVERITSTHFHPRTQARRTRWAVGGAVIVAGAATATAALTGATSGQRAFASYSTTPTTPRPGQLSPAYAKCITYSNVISSQPNNPYFAGSRGKWRPAVGDVRGLYVLVIVTAPTSSGTAVASCLSNPEHQIINAGATAPAPTASPGSISQDGGGGGNWGGQMWIGAAGTGVTGVRIHLSNRTTVTATVGGGYVAAWWPSQANMVTADVTTAVGTVQQQA